MFQVRRVREIKTVVYFLADITEFEMSGLVIFLQIIDGEDKYLTAFPNINCKLFLPGRILTNWPVCIAVCLSLTSRGHSV